MLTVNSNRLWWKHGNHSLEWHNVFLIHLSACAFCLNGAKVFDGYWCVSFSLFWVGFSDLFIFIFFIFRFWLVGVVVGWFAASVQRHGRHPPDEALGFGQHQQPVDVEQRRRKQLFQRPRARRSTAPPKIRHRRLSQRTSSPLARKQQQQHLEDTYYIRSNMKKNNNFFKLKI